jgi:hypothetical protein
MRWSRAGAHATFEAAGAGNEMMAAGLRATAKGGEHPPEPKVGAPVLDPTSVHNWGGLTPRDKKGGTLGLSKSAIHGPDFSTCGQAIYLRLRGGRSASITLRTFTGNPSSVRLFSRYRQFGVNHIGPITH